MSTVTESTPATIAEAVMDVLDEFDSRLDFIARESQASAKASLAPGSTIPKWGPRAVAGDRYQAKAREAEADACQKIEAIFDRLDRDSSATSVTHASAEELQNVAFVLDHGNPSAEEIEALYQRYRDRWAITRALRAYSHEHDLNATLPATAAETVSMHKDEARDQALRCAVGRWFAAGTYESNVVPSRWVAQGVNDTLRGLDALGGQLR